MTETGPELDDLLLQHAAERLLREYQALVDAKDVAGLATIVHPDVELTRQDGTRRGVEPFLDLYRAFAASDVEVAQHMVTNVVPRRGEHGSLHVDSCFLALTTHRSGGARMVWGRYHHVLVVHDDRWKIRVKRISIVRTALVPESSLAPLDRDSFAEMES